MSMKFYYQLLNHIKKHLVKNKSILLYMSDRAQTKKEIIIIKRKPTVKRVYTNPYFLYRHYYPYYGRFPYGYVPAGISSRYLYPYMYPATYW